MLPNPMPDKINFSQFLTVTEAARLIGVHPDTLRRWEASGKFKSHRHPINGYRLYLQNEIELLLNQVNQQ